MVLMRVLVSGPRSGWNPMQRNALARLLSNPGITVLIHGGAEGVDSDADQLYREICADYGRDPVIEVYPAHGSRGIYRRPAFRAEPRSPLVRDRIMADKCDAAIIISRNTQEVLRAGEWATKRYAVKDEKWVIIIWPDGSTKVGGIDD